MDSKTCFISHSPSQRLLASTVAKTLGQLGHNIVLYDYDFSPSTDFIDVVGKHLADSDTVIAITAKDYVNSNWCLKEAEFAFAHNKLILLLAEDVDRSALPQVDRYLSLVGLANEVAAAVIAKELPDMVAQLKPREVYYDEACSFIEESKIVLPLFAEGREAHEWQEKAVTLIRQFLVNENAAIVEVSEVAQTPSDAHTVLRKCRADIVLFGVFRNKSLDLGFVASQGWRHSRRTFEFYPLRLQAELVQGLEILLSIAYGSLEIARNARVGRAEAHYIRALQYAYMFGRSHEQGLHNLYYIVGNMISEKKGRAFEALDYFTLAIEIEPRFTLAHSSRGMLYMMLGRYDEALSDFSKWVDLTPNDPKPYNMRSGIHTYMKNADLANADTERAAELAKAAEPSPRNAIYLRNRGHLRLQQKRYIEALEDLNLAIKMDPSDDSAYSNRASAYTALGNTDQAARDRRTAQELSSRKNAKRGSQ